MIEGESGNARDSIFNSTYNDALVNVSETAETSRNNPFMYSKTYYSLDYMSIVIRI